MHGEEEVTTMRNNIVEDVNVCDLILTSGKG
jgi:hypothetical protein